LESIRRAGSLKTKEDLDKIRNWLKKRGTVEVRYVGHDDSLSGNIDQRKLRQDFLFVRYVFNNTRIAETDLIVARVDSETSFPYPETIRVKAFNCEIVEFHERPG